MKRWMRPDLLGLALLAFLAPIIGGQVAREAQPMDGSVLSELMGGSALPLMTRFLLGALVFGSLGYVLLRRRVLQTPAPAMSIAIVILLSCLGISVGQSHFLQTSLVAWLTWFVYFCAFFLTITVTGRLVGVRVILAALVAGCALTAFKGILEYTEIMRQEPTYRIFGGWNNPNALAGILLMVAPLGLGLSATSKGPGRAFAILASLLMFVALGLTQSKGGYLAVGLGLLTFAVCGVGWKCGKKALIAGVPLVLAGLAFFGLQFAAQSGTGGANALSRVTGGGEAQQSAGFRKLLWQSAVELAKDNPLGVGVGTYRYHSAQPGLTEQTMYAHQTYLQLAAEAGPAALLALIALAVIWLVKFLPGSRAMPEDRRILRAALLAAVVAGAAHGFIESNVYYFGIGLVFFVVLGLGVQLSRDASAPELTPPSLRVGLAVLGAGLPLIFLALQGATELKKASFLTAMIKPDASGPADPDSLPSDPEGLYLRALYGAKSPEERLSFLLESAEGAPVTRTLRAVARTAMEIDGQTPTADTAIARALTFDKNNLNTLKQAMDMAIQSGDLELARKWAERLVAVESQPYYQVRALPDVVPTETLEARAFLADGTNNDAEKAELLQGAVDGMESYLARTFPQSQMYEKAGVPPPSGDSVEDSKEKLIKFAEVADELKTIYQRLGRSAEADKAGESAGRFRSAGS